MKYEAYSAGVRFTMALIISTLGFGGMPAAASAQVKADPDLSSSSFEAKGDVPVIILSEQLGDAGVTAAASASVRLPADLVSDVPYALVYADVDSIKDQKAAMSTLRKAKERSFPIVLESFSWDVEALHAFALEFASELDLARHRNVALELSVEDGQLTATDTTPSRTAMLLGIPFEQTDEGRSIEAQASSRNPIDWLATFANLAYQENPGSPYTHFRLEINTDVLKIWLDDSAQQGDFQVGDCVVAWRGSDDIGDWLINGQSQFAFSSYPHPSYPWFGSARIGAGWRTRLDNLYAYVGSVLAKCETVHMTGHSLGGAMASAAGFRVAQTSPHNNDVELAAFNPARVGNASFKTEYLLEETAWAPRIYCRYGDPVYHVPVGLQHIGNDSSGCTVWGDMVAYWGSVENHRMEHWL